MIGDALIELVRLAIFSIPIWPVLSWISLRGLRGSNLRMRSSAAAIVLNTISAAIALIFYIYLHFKPDAFDDFKFGFYWIRTGIIPALVGIVVSLFAPGRVRWTSAIGNVCVVAFWMVYASSL